MVNFGNIPPLITECKTGKKKQFEFCSRVVSTSYKSFSETTVSKPCAKVKICKSLQEEAKNLCGPTSATFGVEKSLGDLESIPNKQCIPCRSQALEKNCIKFNN